MLRMNGVSYEYHPPQNEESNYRQVSRAYLETNNNERLLRYATEEKKIDFRREMNAVVSLISSERDRGIGEIV